MITGFNSEVSHAGVTYHVQTEDMGRDAQRIVTHVFHGGAILLSKRTPYGKILDAGYDENRLKSGMNEQHQKVMLVIKAGRLEDLRRKMEQVEAGRPDPGPEAVGGDGPAPPAGDTSATRLSEDIARSTMAIEHEIDCSLNEILQRYVDRKAQPKKLKIEVVSGSEIVSGQPAVVRIHTLDAVTGAPLEGSKVVIKVIGTSFRPAVYTGRTDKNGVYTLNVIIPEFHTGHAAIMIEASSSHGSDEIKLRVARRA